MAILGALDTKPWHWQTPTTCSTFSSCATMYASISLSSFCTSVRLSRYSWHHSDKGWYISQFYVYCFGNVRLHVPCTLMEWCNMPLLSLTLNTCHQGMFFCWQYPSFSKWDLLCSLNRYWLLEYNVGHLKTLRNKFDVQQRFPWESFPGHLEWLLLYGPVHLPGWPERLERTWTPPQVVLTMLVSCAGRHYPPFHSQRKASQGMPLWHMVAHSTQRVSCPLVCMDHFPDTVLFHIKMMAMGALLTELHWNHCNRGGRGMAGETKCEKQSRSQYAINYHSLPWRVHHNHQSPLEKHQWLDLFIPYSQ